MWLLAVFGCLLILFGWFVCLVGMSPDATRTDVWAFQISILAVAIGGALIGAAL